MSEAKKGKLALLKERAEAKKAEERIKADYRRKFYAESMRMFCRKIRSAEEIEQRRLRACEKAKATWRKKKGDAEWRAKKAAAYKQWGKLNPEKKRNGQRVWLANNRERARQYVRRQRKKPGIKLVENLRRRLRDFVKGKRVGTSAALIGCTREHLRAHIEAQFRDGMTWENYGKFWVLDHITPCAAFSLHDVTEQRRCFHWTNTRPLRSEENKAKRDKIVEPQQSLLLDK